MQVLSLSQGFKPDYIHLILGFTSFNYLVVALCKDIKCFFCRRVCSCVNAMHEDLQIFSFETLYLLSKNIENVSGGNVFSLVQFQMKTSLISFSVRVKSVRKDANQ